MTWWWQRDIAQARQRANEAEQKRKEATMRRQAADQIETRAERVGAQLRKNMIQNHFADALRTAFGGRA